ncbi:DUF2905 domain-containing protein [bacterium]|nr:DUF2905 domain-containing protein [bacterium]
MPSFGKILILFGTLLVILGAIFTLSGKIPYLGKLPGDIYIKKGSFSFYFPLTTCILISIILSLIFWFILRFFE